MDEEWIRKVSLQYRGPTFYQLEIGLLPELISRMEKVKNALDKKDYDIEFDDIVAEGLRVVLPRIEALIADLPDNPLVADWKRSGKRRSRPGRTS